MRAQPEDSLAEVSMLRTLLRVVIASLLIVAPSGVTAQPPPGDAELVAGIKQVDDGDYDRAILTLDNAARRLAGDSSKVSDLSQAYLYLGIAYIGKGHEAAAKAKFREALQQIKDLTLSPEKFPPKVIDAFEAAKQEAANAPAAAAPKKGGSKKGLVIGGIVAAGAAVGVAAGAGAGGGGSSGSSGQPSNGTRTSRTFTGSIGDQGQGFHTVTATRAGTLEATLTWQDRDIRLTMGCQEEAAPYTDCGGQDVRTSDTSGHYQVAVTQKEYVIIVSNYSGKVAPENYSLTVLYP
jgi:hypothetical protein